MHAVWKFLAEHAVLTVGLGYLALWGFAEAAFQLGDRRALRRENELLREKVARLAQRVGEQGELLSRRAEKGGGA